MTEKTQTTETDNAGNDWRRPHHTMRAALLLLGLLLTTPHAAHAYVDPGTGTFLYQGLYAACLGGLFYVRQILDAVWKRRKEK